MGDSDKSKKMISRSEMENFPLDASRFSRDLLNRFMGASSSREGKLVVKEEVGDEGEEIELSLGLSLGGRFGVDKSSKKLMRSSSIAACLPVVRDDDAVAASPPPVSYPSLVRASSLPVETEEEWRKRKELQTLRRMEAKRRRSEKQRNLKADREGSGGLGEEKRDIEVNLRGRLEKDQSSVAAKRFGSSVSPPPLGMAMMAAAAGHSPMVQGFGQPLSQGSVESQGGSSSSELESRPLQGSSSCDDLSPVSIKSLQEAIGQDVGSSRTKLRDSLGRTSGVEMENPSKQAEIPKNQGKEIGMNALEDMPCVFTKGDGPNGRRVDGILYKYGKGEEVRIMCVCHGNFLSPAEFVKHAGGSDVTHPLKHIVVNPNASPFM
ncbi:unnamed protein product [Coffea canephora]|uniref:Ninja-family protein n=1 Tax=Coffea canephora TaxID=49390 RepID=A0A068TVZ8_COFCA|nr:unnamed protein product [Coffea canephora]